MEEGEDVCEDEDEDGVGEGGGLPPFPLPPPPEEPSLLEAWSFNPAVWYSSLRRGPSPSLSCQKKPS